MPVINRSPSLAFLDGRYVQITGSAITGALSITVDDANALLVEDSGGNDLLKCDTTTLVITVDNALVLQGGSITDSSGAISFNDENLTTTGTITATTLTDGTASLTGGALTSATIDGDSNTFSNLDIGNEVDWAAAADVSDRTAFASGDKLLIFEAGVGLRKIDYDDLPAGGGVSFGADNQIPYTNVTTDDFDYSANFTFDGSALKLGSGAAGVDYTFTFDGADSDGVLTWLEDEKTLKLGSTGSGLWLDGVTGDTPTSGAGTRLMWIPSKYAFRAGKAYSDYWDAGNIGDGSICLGDRNKASGTGSIAMGYNAIVTGEHAGGIGINSSVIADYSYVFGRENNAIQAQAAAVGGYNRVGLLSAALGSSVDLYRYSAGLGYEAEAYPEYYCFLFGRYLTSTENNVFQIGEFLSSSAVGASIIGSGVDASNKLANSVGSTLALGIGSTVPTLRLTSGGGAGGYGNLIIGSDSAAGTSAAKVLAISNGTAPTSSPADMVQLYAEDVTASSELKVRDEGGNITTLSPHAFTLFEKPDPMAWSYQSINPYEGKEINVDMWMAIKDLEKITGKTYIYTADLPPEKLENKQAQINAAIREKQIKEKMKETVYVDKSEAVEQVDELETEWTEEAIYEVDEKTGEPVKKFVRKRIKNPTGKKIWQVKEGYDLDKDGFCRNKTRQEAEGEINE